MVWPVNFPSGWLGWFETEVVGQVGKAKCPKNNNKKKSLMHFKTMPQAAGNNQISEIRNIGLVFMQLVP